MLTYQALDCDNESKIVLVNRMNNDALMKENSELRKDTGNIKKTSFPRVASLDVAFLQHDPKGLGQKVLEARSGTPEFRIALRMFLAEYPEFRTSGIKI